MHPPNLHIEHKGYFEHNNYFQNNSYSKHNCYFEHNYHFQNRFYSRHNCYPEHNSYSELHYPHALGLFFPNVFLPSFSVLTFLPSTIPHLSAAFLPIYLPTHQPLWAPWYTQFHLPFIQTPNQPIQRWCIPTSTAPAARYSYFTNQHCIYAAMLHRSSCRRAAFLVNTLHITECSMLWWHGPSTMENMVTPACSPLGTLRIFEGASAAPPMDILTTALTGQTGMRMDSSTLEPELLVSPSISSILNQVNHPQDPHQPMQGPTVIPDGETERLDISANLGTDPLELPDHAYRPITGGQPCINPINTLSGLTEEYVSTLCPDSQFIDDWQCVNATNTLPLPTQNHIPMSSPTHFRVLAPPDKLHLKLTSLTRNMEKLSHLLDHLQKLASSAPAEHQSWQVVTLCAMFTELQVRFIKILWLGEEFAS